MATTTMAASSTSKLELRTAYGPVYRTILNTPPRDCTPAEIPIIDLSSLHSDELHDRKSLATKIQSAATGSGFFYIKSHGIPDEVIANAKKQALAYDPSQYIIGKNLNRSLDSSGSLPN